MAEEQYILYFDKFGYPPAHASHLKAFADENEAKSTWNDCKNVIDNPPNYISQDNDNKDDNNDSQNIKNDVEKVNILQNNNNNNDGSQSKNEFIQNNDNQQQQIYNEILSKAYLESVQMAQNYQIRIQELEEQVYALKLTSNNQQNDDEKQTENKQNIQEYDIINQNVELCYHYNRNRCNKDDECDFIHRYYIDALREYGSKCYCDNQDINVKNIGLYLKNSLDGYLKINDKANPGYIKYGTYARTYCEVLCNYLLQKESFNKTLYVKMKELQNSCNYFPYKEMDDIRRKTNKIVHGVQFNEAAKKRFIPEGDQKKLLMNLYKITWWLFQNYSYLMLN